jgi:hypothetical protein
MTANLDRLAPSWLHESCPAWCVRVHAEDDYEEDRFHQSAPTVVPVIASCRGDSPFTSSFESFDVTIRVGRYAGEVANWIALEPLVLTGRLVLTTESGRALCASIDEQLQRCSG